MSARKDSDGAVPSVSAASAAAPAAPAVAESPLPRELLSRATMARVALGRAGSSLTTRAHLDFVGDHARARDAVWTAVDFDALGRGLAEAGFEVLRLRSRAGDRASYLRRPDLGRCLDDQSSARLADAALAGPSRVALVVADGLSAEAVMAQTVPLIEALLPALRAEGIAPRMIALVEQGRVAIGDPIGEALGAELVAVLIGERPGLSAADSLGCYITWSPRAGTPDSRRNCVSNIRAAGLPPVAAAAKIAWLLRAALERRSSGIALKDESPSAIPLDR